MTQPRSPRTTLLLRIGFVLGLVAMVFFGGRLVYFSLYWSNPAHQNQPIEAWMTIGYVAHSYDVPRERLIEALAIDRARIGRRRTLNEIAEDKGMAFADLKGEIDRVLVALRAEQQKP